MSFFSVFIKFLLIGDALSLHSDAEVSDNRAVTRSDMESAHARGHQNWRQNSFVQITWLTTSNQCNGKFWISIQFTLRWQRSNITLYLENKLGLGKPNAFVILTVIKTITQGLHMGYTPVNRHIPVKHYLPTPSDAGGNRCATLWQWSITHERVTAGLPDIAN